MDTIDPTKAARVWQRVQGEQSHPPMERGLLELIAEEWTDATTYLQLSRRFQGKDSAMLRKMYDDEQAHTACLKGIYTLLTGSRPTIRAATPSAENPEAILRRCYGREMRCLAQYEARSADPEYGQVFARLADQEREHCRMVLELLGNLHRKK